MWRDIGYFIPSSRFMDAMLVIESLILENQSLNRLIQKDRIWEMRTCIINNK